MDQAFQAAPQEVLAVVLESLAAEVQVQAEALAQAFAAELPEVLAVALESLAAELEVLDEALAKALAAELEVLDQAAAVLEWPCV